MMDPIAQQHALYADTQVTQDALLEFVESNPTAHQIQPWLDKAKNCIESLNDIINSEKLSHEDNKKFQTSLSNVQSAYELLKHQLHQGKDIQQEGVDWSNIQSAFKSRITTGIITNLPHLDIKSFLSDAALVFKNQIQNSLQAHDAVKVNGILAARFHKIKDDEIIKEIKYFNVKNEPIYQTTNLIIWFDTNMKQIIERDIEEFQERESGWSLNFILNLTVNINKFNPMRGSYYIPLPEDIQNKKACVNVQNKDDKCFKWAVLSALYPAKCNAKRVSKYEEFEDQLNFSGIAFPVVPNQISVFEKQNNISINIYILKKRCNKHHVSPFHVTSDKKERHVNLLYVQDFYLDEDAEDEEINNTKSPRFHYVWIKDLSRLVREQLTKHKAAIHVCERCLHFFQTVEKLEAHETDCKDINKCKVLLPNEEDKYLCFSNHKNQERVPIIIYADTESLLEPIENDEYAYQRHTAFSIGYYVNCNYDITKSKYVSYRQKNEESEPPAVWFVHELKKYAQEIQELHDNPKTMNQLTSLEVESFNKAEKCHICCKTFCDNDKKVRDHCHLTGGYRGPAHKSCNLKYQNSWIIPVVFHNLSGYDSHLFIKELASLSDGPVTVIPQTKERYISFTKRMKGMKVSFRFIDSLRFMPSSLDTLASYLQELNIVKREFKHCTSEQIELLKRKGVFPYEFASSLEQLQVRTLPAHKEFYSTLSEENISEDDYTHAQRIWDIFEIKTLGDYSDLYLKTDVLLLADVFENFRDSCLEAYGLDPAHYYTTPGFTWDAMLKYTRIKLELLTDIDMLLFIERGIRGGISQCSNRYAKANNPYMGIDYAKGNEEEDKYLLYYDVNNLYGWAMCESLPTGDFHWVKNVETLDLDVPDDSPQGYILEVDLEYPDNIHDFHKDLPMCPEHQAPPNSHQQKLLTTLNDKKRYVLHYRSLKQARNHGLRLKKVHRALAFKQSAWLKPYIDLNSEKRQNSKNDFEKLLFKLFNNAVYGKTMENERKRVDVKLVRKWEDRFGAEAYISRPNFHSCSIFDENLVAIQLTRTEVTIRKPIYIGLCVLDLSKSLVYRFHYEYMKKCLGDKAKLLYTDTDSLIYEVTGVDMYKKMKTDIHEFDTSDYPVNNQFGMPLRNKKVVGLMKDECNGRIMLEFVGLRSKMYAVRIQDQKLIKTIKKAKGVKSSTVKNTITFDDYIDCLRKDLPKEVKQCNIRSRLQVLLTERRLKIALSSHDDKRFLMRGQTDTLPWGHKSLRNTSQGLQKVDEEKEHVLKKPRL